LTKRLKILLAVMAVGAIALVVAPIVRNSWPPTIPIPQPTLPATLIDAKELEDRSVLVRVRDVSLQEFRILLMYADSVPQPNPHMRPQPGCAGLYVLNTDDQRRRVEVGSPDETNLRHALHGALQRTGQPVPEPGTAENEKVRIALLADSMLDSLLRANKKKK
jgi:hypothetical protein